MFQTILTRIGWFLALLLLQVFVFNHVHLWGYATPLPYVFFLLILPAATPRWLYVLLGFAMGLVLDLFTNTPGMAAASMSLVGLLTPILLRAMHKVDDDDENFLPSARTMKWGNFIRYALFLTFTNCALFFLLEAFTFFDWVALLLNILGSTFISTLIIAALELIRTK